MKSQVARRTSKNTPMSCLSGCSHRLIILQQEQEQQQRQQQQEEDRKRITRSLCSADRQSACYQTPTPLAYNLLFLSFFLFHTLYNYTVQAENEKKKKITFLFGRTKSSILFFSVSLLSMSSNTAYHPRQAPFFHFPSSSDNKFRRNRQHQNLDRLLSRAPPQANYTVNYDNFTIRIPNYSFGKPSLLAGSGGLIAIATGIRYICFFFFGHF